MDGGAWWAAVHGVAKSQTWLSNFAFTFPFHALEKEMATHSSVLAWRIPGTGEPGGLPSMGLHRVGHDWSDSAAAAAEIALVYNIKLHVYSIGLPWWLFTFTSVYTSDHHQKFNFNLLPYSWSPLPISPFFLFLFPLKTTTLFSVPVCMLCLVWFVHLLGFSLCLLVFYIPHKSELTNIWLSSSDLFPSADLKFANIYNPPGTSSRNVT